MMKNWKLKATKQCQTCPWIKGNDPYDIPNGYQAQKHADMKSTIALKDPDPTEILEALSKEEIEIFSCHSRDKSHCLGWLVNQITIGNNIALRIKMLGCENRNQIKLIGEQHQNFNETLPKNETK